MVQNVPVKSPFCKAAVFGKLFAVSIVGKLKKI